jgi:hypothetical protein
MTDKETIELGILANNRGSKESKKEFCWCDPEVGVFICEYCAIDSALNTAMRLEMQKALLRQKLGVAHEDELALREQIERLEAQNAALCGAITDYLAHPSTDGRPERQEKRRRLAELAAL